MTTAKFLRAVEQTGWKLAPNPLLLVLDSECRDVVIQQISEYGYSAFRVKLDDKGEVVYFEALKV